ncbi:MAG: hypothetical protein IBX50_18515 [Marinospirillum sp.]|uniref:hypothetical protein n=1 Tax=Marinospirillum sp. TaxID=2183934 RepID=UPI0019F37310|nr:hypothetical protein [Marinospirillum sp.]MBE0508681.1 hypothetical protein [Marinospirillum sp.]
MNQNKINVPPQQQATPPPIPPHDNGWTLNAINSLSASVGRLEQSAANIEKTLDKLDKRFEKVEDKVTGMDRRIYAAGIVIVILISVGGFIVNKAVDFGMDMAKEAIKAEQQDNNKNEQPR